MKKSKIYTKTGDAGETSLVGGTRALKSDLRIDLYGDLDELNSRIGYAASLMSHEDIFASTVSFLHQLQSALFDLGSNLACEFENRAQFNLPQIQITMISELERLIDLMDQDLKPLKSFILPGGTLAASAVHLCRTKTRSVERKMVHYEKVSGEPLPENALIFLNRLSDYLFVLARHANHLQKGEEILWQPRS